MSVHRVGEATAVVRDAQGEAVAIWSPWAGRWRRRRTSPLTISIAYGSS